MCQSLALARALPSAMAEQEAEELVAKAEKKLKVGGEGSVLRGSARARRALGSLGRVWSGDCTPARLWSRCGRCAAV
jgi:hypothetical protein